MQRTCINSLFNHTKSLPLEVSLEQATEWVNIQARTPAGKSNSWFNFLNSIIMVGIIIAIGAFCLTPSLSQPETTAHSLTLKTPLESPVPESQFAFAMTELRDQEEPIHNNTSESIHQVANEPTVGKDLGIPLTTKSQYSTTKMPLESKPISPENSSYEAFYISESTLDTIEAETIAAGETSSIETPTAIASSHQISLFADGHTADWNNSVKEAKANGIMLNACKLKRSRRGIVKKLDLSVLAKRPQASFTYRGFLRISTNKFDRLDFAWDLKEDGSVCNFRYSINGGEDTLIDEVHKSCSRVKYKCN